MIFVSNLSVVLFPQPLLPINPTASPLSTVNEIPFSIGLFSNLFLFQKINRSPRVVGLSL